MVPNCWCGPPPDHAPACGSGVHSTWRSSRHYQAPPPIEMIVCPVVTRLSANRRRIDHVLQAASERHAAGDRYRYRQRRRDRSRRRRRDGGRRHGTHRVVAGSARNKERCEQTGRQESVTHHNVILAPPVPAGVHTQFSVPRGKSVLSVEGVGIEITHFANRMLNRCAGVRPPPIDAHADLSSTRPSGDGRGTGRHRVCVGSFPRRHLAATTQRRWRSRPSRSGTRSGGL
jgi:hypothetical protein